MMDIDRIAKELRTSEPHFVDDGFTHAVLARLPSRREVPLWVQNLILLVATAAGSGIAASQVSIGPLVATIAGASLNLPVIFGAAALIYVASTAAVWVLRNEVL